MENPTDTEQEYRDAFTRADTIGSIPWWGYVAAVLVGVVGGHLLLG